MCGCQTMSCVEGGGKVHMVAEGCEWAVGSHKMGQKGTEKMKRADGKTIVGTDREGIQGQEWMQNG